MFGDLTNRLSVQAVSHVRAMMNGDSGPSEDALDLDELLFWEGVLNQFLAYNRFFAKKGSL